MRLLLDTNVILDFLGINDGFSDDAEDVINLAITGDAIELVSASAITDIYYVACKRLKDRQKVINLISNMQNYIHILPVTEDDISIAIKRNWKDFEDAVQYSVAVSNQIDYIITRNPQDFEEDNIPIFTPKQFLAIVGDLLNL